MQLVIHWQKHKGKRHSIKIMAPQTANKKIIKNGQHLRFIGKAKYTHTQRTFFLAHFMHSIPPGSNNVNAWLETIHPQWTCCKRRLTIRKFKLEIPKLLLKECKLPIRYLPNHKRILINQKNSWLTFPQVSQHLQPEAFKWKVSQNLPSS